MGDQLRSGSRFKVLVVEDESELRDAMVQALDLHFGEALEVRAASGGNVAIQMLQTERYSFVVSDLNMPDGHGLQLGSYIENLPDTPFLLFFSSTANLSLPFKNENFLGIVQKPDVHKVMKIVGDCLCLG